MNGETDVLFKWGVPIGWLALFEPENQLVQPCYPFGVDDEAFPGLFLVSDLTTATERFRNREQRLAELFGPPWSEKIEEFKRYLANPKASHVQLDAHELLDDNRPPEILKEYHEEIFQAFDEPLYCGKKTLLTRKPKLSRGWRMIRREVLGLTTGELHPSVLFGWHDDWTWS